MESYPLALMGSAFGCATEDSDFSPSLSQQPIEGPMSHPLHHWMLSELVLWGLLQGTRVAVRWCLWWWYGVLRMTFYLLSWLFCKSRVSRDVWRVPSVHTSLLILSATIHIWTHICSWVFSYVSRRGVVGSECLCFFLLMNVPRSCSKFVLLSAVPKI